VTALQIFNSSMLSQMKLRAYDDPDHGCYEVDRPGRHG
jgi:hypothetical protein